MYSTINMLNLTHYLVLISWNSIFIPCYPTPSVKQSFPEFSGSLLPQIFRGLSTTKLKPRWGFLQDIIRLLELLYITASSSFLGNETMTRPHKALTQRWPSLTTLQMLSKCVFNTNLGFKAKIYSKLYCQFQPL